MALGSSGPSSAVACPSGVDALTTEGVPVDELGRSRIVHSFFLEEPELHAWEDQWLGVEVLLLGWWLETHL